MSTLKTEKDIVGASVPFKWTEWKKYKGYQIYTTGKEIPLFIHKKNLEELMDSGHKLSDMPKFIIGKITHVDSFKAQEHSRYDLGPGEGFGIATLSFDNE